MKQPRMKRMRHHQIDLQIVFAMASLLEAIYIQTKDQKYSLQVALHSKHAQ